MPTFVPTWQAWIPQKSVHMPLREGAESAKREDVNQPMSTNPPSWGSAQSAKTAPPSYPGAPVGAPFRPGQRVWLYRWDDQTPRFDTPVNIVQMRTLWPGEQDIGWRNAAGELTWHNARLAVAVEPSGADARTKDLELLDDGNPGKEDV